MEKDFYKCCESYTTHPRESQVLNIITNHRILVEKRIINHGRRVITKDLDLYEVNSKFSRINVDSFLDLNLDIFPQHVREFYAGFSFDGVDTIKLHMYGTFWKWNLATFGNILQIPFCGLCFYSETGNYFLKGSQNHVS